MNFFTKYIKSRLGGLVVFFVCSAVFAAAFYLYHLPLKAVLYPALLCAALLAFYLTFGFIKAYRKHKRLTELFSLPENLVQDLEDFNGETDGDYREIIRLLHENEMRLIQESSDSFSDMIDYYTTWAHQIKTPIASMRLTLQNEDSALSRRLTEDLFRIEQYVEMVLCYLRLGSDHTDYVFKEYDIDTIIRQVLRKYASQFIGKGIKLNYAQASFTAVTDEKWLSFVIEQVLSNALKYTSSGSISITTEEPMTLCISDTGIGIASEDLPRVFEKGYTGHNGRHDKSASGLGLYLCKRICGNLGHTVTAQSVLGEGTTVKICMAQKKAEVE